MIGYVPEVAVLYDTLTPNEFLMLVGRLYQSLEENSIKRKGL